MKRLPLQKSFLIIGIASWLFSSTVPAQEQPHTVSAVVMQDIVPLSFVNSGGKPDGFFTELLKEIGNRNGFSVTFSTHNWAEGLDQVKNGAIDIMPSITRTPEREQYLDFNAIPVILCWGILAIHSDSSLSSLTELDGKTIGLMRGDQNALNFKKLVADFHIECSYREFDNHQGIIPAIEKGAVYAGVFFNLFPFAHHKIKQTGIIFNPVQSFFAATRGTNADLLRKIDDQLQTWKSDKGSLYFSLLNKYTPSLIVERTAIPRWAPAAIAGVLLLLVMLVLWLVTLRIAVIKRTAELRQSKTRLEESEAHYRSLFEHLNTAVMVATSIENDVDFECIDLNDAAEKTLQINRADTIGRRLSDIFHDSDGSNLINHCRLAFSSDQPRQFVHSETDNSRISKYIEHQVYRLPAGQIVILSNDRTEQKKLEERLRQSEKMEVIGQLAGGIAHDFNNILGAIIGYADMSLDDAPVGSRLEKNCTNILKAGDRARHLVNQILSFSRQSNDQKKPLFMQPQLKEVIKFLRASLPSSIEIVGKLAIDVKPVLADAAKIHEIFINLCSNAAHAMNGRGTILISCEEKDVTAPLHGRFGVIDPGFYTIASVNDTGCGIPEKALVHIFEPFFTTKPVGEGTGMGLAVVFGIMQSHGGNIIVESEPDRGTGFHLYFPKTDLVAYIDTPDDAMISGGTERILCVDDEEILTDMLNDILTDLGYRVTVTTDSLYALQLFKKDPDAFDIVITDQTMPAMNGIDFAKEIIALRNNLPVILCTGYSKSVNEEAARNAGIRGFCMKPHRIKDIAHTIRAILDEKAA